MTTNTEQQFPVNSGQNEPNGFQKFMRSHTARFIIVGFITLILLIPLQLINELIQERKYRQSEVTEQLKTEWGDAISYYGLVLKVPVISTVPYSDIDEQGKQITAQKTEVHPGYFYPESSSDSIVTAVSRKYRGIFKAIIFNASISGRSTFDIGKIIAANPGTKIDWSKARICLLTNKTARFKELSDVTVNMQSLPVENDESSSDYSASLLATAPFTVDTAKTKMIYASVKTAINGSESVQYKPLAKKSEMSMSSNWKDPAFAGSSLPNGNSLKVSEKGFTASWNNLNVTGSSGKLHASPLAVEPEKVSEIRFIKLVDQYQLNERTAKYGILVFILTFAVFFLIQIVGRVDVHPLHYFMIGLSLLLFYSLLLSFSEQIGFIPAYLLASAAIIALIVWYAKSILKSMKFAFMSGISLGLLYAFLLVIVNLEVYALIVGSIGLLFVLAAIMSVTRKLNFENA